MDAFANDFIPKADMLDFPEQLSSLHDHDLIGKDMTSIHILKKCSNIQIRCTKHDSSPNHLSGNSLEQDELQLIKAKAACSVDPQKPEPVQSFIKKIW